MGDYDHDCEVCAKNFNIRDGEGVGVPYFKPGAMLPSTRWICKECFEQCRTK